MQDIVPKGTRSIRKVPLPENRERTASKAPAAPREEAAAPRRRAPEPISPLPDPRTSESQPHERAHRDEGSSRAEALRSAREEFESSRISRGRRKKSAKKALVAAAVVAVIALAIFVSNLFHSAVLSLTPRSASASVSDEFTASVSGAGLSYEPISFTETGSLSVKATGEEAVSKKATGTIVIYNDYNSSSQRLIKNTRFETPEGLIYRITDSVTVPGKKGSTPGSVEAVVTADEPGEKYNVGFKDFTIPGFKGDPRYSAFYARSKTPLSGGFVGTRKVVSDADRKKAESAIEAEVTANLLKRAEAEMPADKIFFDKAYAVSFASLPDEASGNDAIIKKEGTLVVAAFDRAELSSVLAKQKVQGYKDEPVLVTNLDDISFAPKSGFDPGSGKEVSFSLVGDAAFEWTYDEPALRTALAGLARSDIPAALQAFPMIEKADISIRPFWSRSFPGSVEKISVRKADE